MNNTVRLFLIILFVYAAVSKLVIINTFQEQIAQSPIIPENLVIFTSYFIPFLEIVISLLLTIDKYYFLALILSFITMLSFSAYLIILYFLFQHNLPCACGGILNNMGYPEHIAFNIIIVIIIFFTATKYPNEAT